MSDDLAERAVIAFRCERALAAAAEGHPAQRRGAQGAAARHLRWFQQMRLNAVRRLRAEDRMSDDEYLHHCEDVDPAGVRRLLALPNPPLTV